MARGYMGRLLFVDLSSGKISDEMLEENNCRDFIGGYGIGARVIYDRQKAGANALGPANTLGLITGPLTGTAANTGARFCVIAKSPRTGGFGDSNCGGHFGPYLKSAGYDGVFVTGASAIPAYLLIDNGRAELRDARHIWGKNTYETEDAIQSELGKEAEVLCIGRAGEKLSHMAGLITERGAAAARFGFGAVMGSKKLKAVVARGSQKVPVADAEALTRTKQEHFAKMKTALNRGMPFVDAWHKYGTSSTTVSGILSGDVPVKNWGGIGVVDVKDPAVLSGDVAIANLERRSGCWHCPVACEGRLKEGTGEYVYPAGTRRPEYETIATFGTMCLNKDMSSIIMANHICNDYGLDTISAGCTIAFAIECFENGLVTKKDTGGIELTWGNHKAIVAMTEIMAKREGFGDLLADGVKIAAAKIGRGAERYAFHVGGQEIMMHDLRMPARSGAANVFATHRIGPASFERNITNCSGFCLFGMAYSFADAGKYQAQFLAAVTGWDRSWEDLLKIGERIANIKHVLSLREGSNPAEWKVPGRLIGLQPHMEGPLTGITVDISTQMDQALDRLDWDRTTTKPSKKKLIELGLRDVASDLWPED